MKLRCAATSRPGWAFLLLLLFTAGVTGQHCTTVPLNQRTNGGTWVNLGSFALTAGTTNTVTLQTTGTDGYVIADAVRFVRAGAPTVTLDNPDAGVAFAGNWSNSTSTSGYLGANYRHDGNTDKGNKSATYTPNLSTAGTWEVAVRYTSGANRASNVPILICSGAAPPSPPSGNDCATVTVNQQAGGGQWQTLGTYAMAAGSDNTVTISNANTTGYVMADAIRFTRDGTDPIVIDNEDPAVTFQGDWTSSSATSGYVGSAYRHDQKSDKGSKSAEYRPSLPVGGDWTVAINYPSGGNRDAAVPVTICVAPPSGGGPNVAPTADFTFTPSLGTAPVAIAFDATPSSDSDGAITGYRWDFGDGTYGAGATVDHNYGSGGDFDVTLYVTDDGRATAAATRTVSLNGRPTASISATPRSGDAPLVVRLDANGSSDPDGPITSYTWDLGDGSTATGDTLSHTYTAPGTYRVELTVTDNSGATDQTSTYISVSRALVDWGGTYVTGSQAVLRGGNQQRVTGLDIDGDGAFDDATVSLPFSTTEALTPAAGYSGVPLYGGFVGRVLNSTSPSFSDRSVRASATGDYLNLRLQANADFHGVFYFDKADFLQGGATQAVQFDALSNLTFSTLRLENLGEVRFLVREGSTFYVSEATVGSKTLAFPGHTRDGNWAVFDPATELNLDAAAASFGPQNFTDITAVGLVIDQDQIANARHWLQLDNFVFRGDLGSGAAVNTAPVASFSVSPKEGRAPVEASFNATGSFDPDGSIASYTWDFGDGTSANGVTANHTYTTVGSYPVSLVVTDVDGASTSSSQTFPVGITNRVPVARIYTPEAQREAPYTFTFDGLDSADPVGNIVDYRWDFGDGTRVSGLTVDHTYASAGQYTVRLTVTDDDGATATDQIDVRATINGALPPRAVINRDPGAGPPPLLVVFDATASVSPESPIQSYAWDLGDGTTATTPTVSHTYNALGNYTISLVVNNAAGLADTALTTVSVSVYPNTNPVADFYGAGAYPWTDQINWSNVVSVTDFGGVADGSTDNLAAFNAAQDAVVAGGGGVVYFPAGTYFFGDDLYIKDKVLLRGDLPPSTDAKIAGYDPPTNFEFPAYQFSEAGTGTANSTAFKLIKLDPATANSASNVGLVYIDVNRAGIELVAIDKVNATGENMLFFGVRSNNVAKPTPGVPKLSVGQKEYQRHSYRFAYNILGYNFRNLLVANTRSNDAVTDNYSWQSFVVDDGGTPKDLTGGKAVFNYTDHYVIEIGQGSGLCAAATPTTCPQNFREGMEVRDNWMFHTMRTALYARGQGLIVRGNVIRDQQGKQQYVHPTGTRAVSNGNTLENRGIDWAGWDVLIDDNDVEVFRHRMNDSPYLSVDGEGILLQECCGGTTVNGLEITNNTVNSYIGLYKVRDINDAYIAYNDISTGTTDIDIIYIVANTNNGSYSINNTVVEYNDLTGARANIRFRGDGAPGSGNVIRNNSSSGGRIIYNCEVNPIITGNTGFTIEGCDPAAAQLNPTGGTAARVVEGVRVYPNPAADAVTVELPLQEVGSIRLYDSYGRLLHENLRPQARQKISLQHYPPGLYLLDLEVDGQGSRHKLTVH